MLIDIKIITIERVLVFVVAGAIHAGLLFGVVVNTGTLTEEEVPAREIRLVTIQEEVPAAPAPQPLPDIPKPPPETPPDTVEEPLAETVVETEDAPDPMPKAPVESSPNSAPLSERRASSGTEYINQAKVEKLPVFDTDAIKRALVYPPLARNSNLEGRVFLELFVDAHGIIRQIAVLREEPPGWGFAEAARAAFEGVKALTPAQSGGIPVGVRYRYPLRFALH
ncbi:MAG: energy transducer TonB [Spirochaetaceae bacterium]|jgi:protein TonB|nr:energy transducer TonB [Spirochaetaceae bacterium]